MGAVIVAICIGVPAVEAFDRFCKFGLELSHTFTLPLVHSDIS